MNPVSPAIGATIRVVKTEGGLAYAESPNGGFWIPARDVVTLGQMLTEQNEKNVYEIGAHGIRADDVVLDCGANVGVFTRYALKRGARKVVAIDPAPEIVECLRRNFADEIQSGRVVVVPEGVWNEAGTLDFIVDRQSWSSRIDFFHESGDKIRVPLTTIDELVSRLRLDKVDFIKMDIEGAEKQALLGARSTLARFRPRMSVALEHLREDLDEIPALIRSLYSDVALQFGGCAMERPSGDFRVQPQVLVAHSGAK